MQKGYVVKDRRERALGATSKVLFPNVRCGFFFFGSKPSQIQSHSQVKSKPN